MSIKSISYFQILSTIGEGGFGSVYLVRSTENQKIYALKTEPLNSKRKTLEFEITILKQLQNCKHFPKYLIDGQEDDHRFLVMELCGPNLTSISQFMPHKYFQLEYLPKLCDEMLSCIEEFHSKGFVHRDIKPQNFVVRLNGNPVICLIDYGISKRYIDKATGKHLNARDHVQIMGTPLFASPYTHDRMDLSRRDDLYSLLYSMCYISETGLPWGGQDTIEQMGEMKHKYPLDILLIPLGEAFVEIGKHVESLQYSDTPNYALMHQILRKSITTEKPFQWMALNPTLSPKKSKEIPLENDPTGFLVENCPFLQISKENCLLI